SGRRCLMGETPQTFANSLLKPRLHRQNPPSRVEEIRRLKPRLHKQNPPTRVEEIRRLKPRLHKQNPPSRVEFPFFRPRRRTSFV
ncbi:hypothetical protein, partial [Tychonema bourrellyi]|uniref:hypothetical protein n=1 Tax=Tychonema bourrellyi TaxID=54313 RepID=UPI001C557DFE